MKFNICLRDQLRKRYQEEQQIKVLIQVSGGGFGPKNVQNQPRLIKIKHKHKTRRVPFPKCVNLTWDFYCANATMFRRIRLTMVPSKKIKSAKDLGPVFRRGTKAIPYLYDTQ